MTNALLVRGYIKRITVLPFGNLWLKRNKWEPYTNFTGLQVNSWSNTKIHTNLWAIMQISFSWNDLFFHKGIFLLLLLFLFTLPCTKTPSHEQQGVIFSLRTPNLDLLVPDLLLRSQIFIDKSWYFGKTCQLYAGYWTYWNIERNYWS